MPIIFHCNLAFLCSFSLCSQFLPQSHQLLTSLQSISWAVSSPVKGSPPSLLMTALSCLLTTRMHTTASTSQPDLPPAHHSLSASPPVPPVIILHSSLLYSTFSTIHLLPSPATTHPVTHYQPISKSTHQSTLHPPQ